MDISFSYLYTIPLTFIVLYIITTNFSNKLNNHPPSPPLTLPILGHLYLFKKPLHRALAAAASRHGPDVLSLQLGTRRVLLVSSAAAAEECFTRNDVVFANRPRLLAGKHIGYEYKGLSFAPYGEHWRNLRRLCAVELFSGHRLEMVRDVRGDEVGFVVRKLFASSRNGGDVVEMKTVFFDVTLNVMMRMIAGVRYFGGESTEEVEEAARFRDIVVETFRLGGASNLGDFLPILNWLGIGGLEKQLVALQKKRDLFMQELIDKLRKGMGSGEGKGKKKTMIEVLLELQETDPGYYTDKLIRSLMLVLLSAGTDTSANTMEWALSLLVNNPEVLKKAQVEIGKVVGQDRLYNEADITELPYLRCIVNEVLRMYPAGPLLVPHESSEDCVVGGYNIPRGTMLLVNVWAIQNDPKNWSEPWKFKPERFEGIEGARDGFKLMPFGSGRRSCPGEGLAMRMIGLVLGSLIQCFDWERISEEMVDMTEGPGLTMPRSQPLVVKFRPRPSMANLLSQI